VWRIAEIFLWRVPLGAITAILVAWGCALYCKPDSITRQFVAEQSTDSGRRAWTWNDRHGFGVAWLWISEGIVREEPPDQRRDPPHWIRIELNPAVQGQDLYLAAGWPMLALSARENGTALRAGAPGRWALGQAQRNENWEYVYVMARSNSGDPYDGRLLPLLPIVPGLAVNVAFWTGAWMMLIAPLIHLRGIRRGRRGLCPDCKYDLRGCASDRCPECGRSIARLRSTLPAPNRQA